MTPLVLIVGFLGSGKTTLLRRLVPLLVEKGLSPSIVLNDYQNARVDAALFQELQTAVTPISGSCVCCGSREALLEALDAHRHAPGSVLLVETNGTTDAEELVALLAADPRLRSFSLPCQISVIDAKRWQKRFWHNSLEASQVSTATHLYLAHSDEVDEERRDAVLKSLAGKHAPLPPLSLDEMASTLVHLSTQCAMEDERRPACATCDCDHGHHEHDGREENEDHHGHHHHEPHDHEKHHFSALELSLPHLISRKDFEDALRALPKEILRAKGLVRFAEDPSVLHIFQKITHFDEVHTAPLEGEPFTDQPIAVFIGARIDSGFPAQFSALVSPGRAD